MGGALLNVTDDNFEAEIEKHASVAVVDFGATWCGPCQMLAPVMAELAAELAGKVKIAKADLDTSPDVASRFGIQSIPCLVLFKNGQEVDRAVGAQSKAQLKKWIESHLQ
ncbi:MAG: thioredoxin [Planctomycetota bacterium]|nr:thioredoxin [Planctomycetota bacterium]